MQQIATRAQRMSYAVNWPFTISLVAVVVLVILIYKEWQKNKRSDTEKEADRDVKNRELSYDKSTYYQLADSLYQAFNPWPMGMGTDEDETFRILGLLENQSDWNMLISAWGDRSGTLPAWIQSELDSGDIKKAQKLLNEKGIIL